MQEDGITAHYGSDDLVTKIFNALVKAGKDTKNLELKDLSVIDQLHTGGHLATIELAKRASISKGDKVLDAGCGIGGTSRILAKEFGCDVTALDLTPQFIDAAKELTLATKLTSNISFICKDITNTALLDNYFDCIWCQHTLMNIKDKAAAFSEFQRVLKPGGFLVFHEIVKGDGDLKSSNDQQEIYLPVPWASCPEISFLISLEEMEQIASKNGFTPTFIEDRTQNAKSWWQKVKSVALKNINSPPPPLGAHIIFGDNGRLFGNTMTQNLDEGRIKMVEALYVAQK
ncbi:MAG: methyltransferase domain-containing protein [Desulfamplus sp.]|nr:methyltransferase domain-containing protein [Desulfamplus sp.]